MLIFSGENQLKFKSSERTSQSSALPLLLQSQSARHTPGQPPGRPPPPHLYLIPSSADPRPKPEAGRPGDIRDCPCSASSPCHSTPTRFPLALHNPGHPGTSSVLSRLPDFAHAVLEDWNAFPPLVLHLRDSYSLCEPAQMSPPLGSLLPSAVSPPPSLHRLAHHILQHLACNDCCRCVPRVPNSCRNDASSLLHVGVKGSPGRFDFFSGSWYI